MCLTRSGTLTFFSFEQLVKVLDDFLERLNHFYPNSKLTHERSREEINILDVTVRGNQGEFITNLYCKPTDGHQCLHFETCHPSHTKSSSIFSQALGMRKKNFLRGVILLPKLNCLGIDWFRERSYQEDMVNKKTNIAPKTPSLGRSKTSERNVLGNDVLLVVNHNPFIRENM